MRTNAVIKIISIQKTENGENVGEMSVLGRVVYGENENVIEYIENNEEMGPIETTITVSNNTVGVIRKGKFGSEMMIEKGKRHLTFYKTPYGELVIGLYGKQVDWSRSETGASLIARYSLDFNNGVISENTMKIYIEEK